MRCRQLLLTSILLLSSAGAAASQPTGSPPQGEDYGHARLPTSAYSKMVLPSDNAAVPQTPAKPQSESNPEGGGGCGGIGCPPTEVSIAQHLLASGPDTSEIYGTFESPANQFAVVGFVREGWPLSVEYEAQPDTV